MRVSYIDNEKMINLNLPSQVWGNYWVKDSTDEEGQNIINIEAHEGSWKMTSNTDTSIIYNGMGVPEVILETNKFYTLEEAKTRELTFIYTSEVYDETYSYYEPLEKNAVLKIGKNQDCDIVFSNANVEDINNELFYQDGKWAINDVDSRFGTYINNRREKSKILENGDFVFIMGLKIIVMSGQILINNPSNQVRVNNNKLAPRSRNDLGSIGKGNDLDPNLVDLYTDKEFFIRSPRFRTSFEPSKMKIDEPPSKKEEAQKPAILVIGPMLTMAMMSLSMVLPVIVQLVNKETTFAKAWPRLIMSGTMLMGSLLWPLLNNVYSKKQNKKYEAMRIKKYREYVDFKASKLAELGAAEKAALIDNNVSPDDCSKIIMQKNRRLWERDRSHSDFMQLRLGVGNAPLSVEVQASDDKFSLEDDVLKEYLNNTVQNHSLLAGVPIIENFTKKNIIAIEGRRHLLKEFMNNLIIQITAFHSYKDLKIVFLTSELYQNDWEFVKSLPHTWSDDQKVRYFATTAEEMKNISFVLEQEVKARFPSSGDTDDKTKILEKIDEQERFKVFNPYYVIITDNFKVARNLQAVENIIGHSGNYGFSIIIMDENLSSAPPECKAFISVGEKTSGLFESELIANKQKIFTVDKSSFDVEECANIMANIPIEMAKGEYSLPNTISFLQMYKAGMIEQLNPVNRWKKNNPVTSLAAPVGIGTNGELFKIDLHEKFHGPHGLVAGMTGSGKSEWIITYILSMAVNFHPDEVQFVLIDYKGGGLAGAFENRETGMRLPHLSGTITNLDVSEINRSLVSINSELKRRQTMFNKARDKLGEGTIDIYKYQRYYREGALEEPISHLFIISDEFAELKAQQPEFMDELISTARIGRSLGVHLILATQKPSGVVNDQIWSNSRFRICLKVQDASDSKEMIKRPDAAALKQAGRFYLQVGYDEFFALGQSAWAGAQYIPSSKVVKQIDDSLEFVDQTGNVIKTINNQQEEDGEKKSLGEELPNIVKYISEIAEHEKIEPKRLWLDKIPFDIYIGNLQKKYSYKNPSGKIVPVIGEYDIPFRQEQKILTVDLREAGNMWLVGLTNKEMFFRTLIYSSMLVASPEDLNIYILDFDTEALRVFDGAPQVGDFVVSTEEEKVTNLLKMLSEEKVKRKALLKDYNGSYEYYLKTSGKKLPLIMVLINSFENFIELYPDLEEEIRSFTRDCNKFGISFVIGSLVENGVRSAIRQNFITRFVLDVNDPYEYRAILTMDNKLVPAKGAGRGVCVFDETGYEFQTAQFCLPEKINDVVKSTIEKLKETYKTKARRIPILPEIVTEDLFEDKSFNKFPIGVYTESLENAYIDLSSNFLTSILSEYMESVKPIVATMANIAENIGLEYRFWDISREFREVIPENRYLSSGIGQDLDSLISYVNNAYQAFETGGLVHDAIKEFKKVMVFFNGIAALFKEISREKKAEILQMMKMAQEMNLVSFMILEEITTIKASKYDEWYTMFYDNKYGIFVGNGIENTMVYQISVMDRTLREQIPNNFGYFIKKGRPERVKFVQSINKEEEDAK